MQSRLHRAELRAGDARDFCERKILHEMQQQHGTLRQGKLFDQLHELSLLFAPDEQFARVGVLRRQGLGDFRFERFFAPAFAPAIHAFAMRDAEETILRVKDSQAPAPMAPRPPALRKMQHRLVARADFKLDRTTNTLVIPGLWLEDKATGRDPEFGQALARGLADLLRFLGADKLDAGAVLPVALRKGLPRRRE